SGDIFPIRYPKSQVLGYIGPYINWVMKDFDSTIATCNFFCYCQGSITAAVINNNQLHVTPCLLKDGFSGMPESGLRIERRHNYSDKATLYRSQFRSDFQT